MVSRRAIALSIVFGIFFVGLFSVTFVPDMYDAQQSDANAFNKYDEGDTDTLTDGLRISNIIVPNQNEVEVTLRNEVNRTSVTQVIPEDTTHTYQFQQGNVSVTVENIIDDQSATLFVTYPVTFGFSDNAKLLTQVIPVVVAIFLVFLYGGMIVGVFNE